MNRYIIWTKYYLILLRNIFSHNKIFVLGEKIITRRISTEMFDQLHYWILWHFLLSQPFQIRRKTWSFSRDIISMKCSFGIRRRISGTSGLRIDLGERRNARGIGSRCQHRSWKVRPRASPQFHRTNCIGVGRAGSRIGLDSSTSRGNYILGWNAGAQPAAAGESEGMKGSKT